MTREELIELRRSAWLSSYLSPRVLWRHLTGLRRPMDAARYLNGALGLGRMLAEKLTALGPFR